MTLSVAGCRIAAAESVEVALRDVAKEKVQEFVKKEKTYKLLSDVTGAYLQANDLRCLLPLGLLLLVFILCVLSASQRTQALALGLYACPWHLFMLSACLSLLCLRWC